MIKCEARYVSNGLKSYVPPSQISRQTRAEFRTVEDLVNTLSESELLALNQRVVERHRILQQQRAQQNMTQFRLGNVVCFIDNDGREIAGVIIRLNKKTVSVHSETGGRWTVSPHFLTLIKRPAINEGAPQEPSFICNMPDPLNKLTH